MSYLCQLDTWFNSSSIYSCLLVSILTRIYPVGTEERHKREDKLVARVRAAEERGAKNKTANCPIQRR